MKIEDFSTGELRWLLDLLEHRELTPVEANVKLYLQCELGKRDLAGFERYDHEGYFTLSEAGIAAWVKE